MSRYGWLTCHNCRIVLWLGKAVIRDDKVHHFHIGSPERPRNWENVTLNRALWKMLADHARHPLQVVIEGDPDYDSIGDYAEIGGDELKDIPFEIYLKDWEG